MITEIRGASSTMSNYIMYAILFIWYEKKHLFIACNLKLKEEVVLLAPLY
jgi:hypothetical protein